MVWVAAEYRLKYQQQMRMGYMLYPAVILKNQLTEVAHGQIKPIHREPAFMATMILPFGCAQDNSEVLMAGGLNAVKSVNGGTSWAATSR